MFIKRSFAFVNRCILHKNKGLVFPVSQGGGVKGGHLHETTKAWITLVQAVCSGMKLGYTGDKAEREAAAAEEEMSWAEEEESLRWRKSVRSGSNRLIDKRQAITYETQVDLD